MPTIQETIDAFLSQDFSDNTRKTYRKSLKYLLDYLPELGLSPTAPVAEFSNLDRLHGFGVWLGQQPLSANTRALTYNVLSNYVNFLIKEEYLPQAEYTAHLRLKERLGKSAKRERQQRQLALKLPDQAMVQALVAAAKVQPAIPPHAADSTRRRATLIWLRNLAIVLLLQSSGVRVGELVALYRRDLNLDKRSARVVGKGQKERFVRYSPEATAAIRNYLDYRQDGEVKPPAPLGDMPVFCRHDKRAGAGQRSPLTTRSVERVIETLAKEADIYSQFHMTPHKLRHFFGSEFLRGTGDLAMTQEFLGHESANTTRIYAQPSPEDMSAAHDQVFGKVKKPGVGSRE